ncbi:hypothetical protein KKI34_08020 [Pseudoalteromonas tetraodonis]|uniref:hypothetical protein n=1 Tax=Pseudoalteromonas tetraodonis TaxID=43659 RepID=UPI001BDE5C70|nr:hypothetical protein [Pseudoalteromonas tetraodonis]MBT2151757.1 hypothetical protein [Pseudoalteromonas tetraodonis]
MRDERTIKLLHLLSMYKLVINENGIGEIQIGDFRESFLADFSFWSKSDYEVHWREASAQLAAGRAVSFITSITDPSTSNFIRSWACYPIECELVFQEQILFLEELQQPFNINEPHFNALPYESVTEEGEKISEWRLRA